MARPPQATKSAGDEPHVQDQDTSRTTPVPALLSLPLEIRFMILAACVIPSWIEEDSDHTREPCWYLSHTISKSILLLSKQLRTEAFTALARYPSLTVICIVRDEFSIPDAYPPTLENFSVTAEAYLHNFRRVFLQCKRLPAPRGRKLTLRLYDYHDPPSFCEIATECLAENVCVAADLWPVWESVFIDADGLDVRMMTERKTWSAARLAHLEWLWKHSGTYLLLLRDWTRTMRVESRGWPEDPIFESILKKLEKGVGNGNP
jgi:hypothetical protein